MADDISALPPSASTDEPAPLRVIPIQKDSRIEHMKDMATYAVALLSVAGVIYLIVYAASCGWHDGIRYD